MGTHSCRVCHVELVGGENAPPSFRSRRQYICNRCRREDDTRRRIKDPQKYLVQRARLRAKAKGLPFNLRPQDIEIPEYCPVLGYPLSLRGSTATSPSIDRIKPELGYVRGNVRVLSHRANALIWDSNVDELRRVLEFLEREGTNR